MSENRTKLEEFYILEQYSGITKIKSAAHDTNLLLTCASSSTSTKPDDDGNNCIQCAETSEDDNDQWYLHKDARNGHYSITSIQNAKYLSCSNSSHHELSTVENHNETETTWSIELLTGELCFISLSGTNTRLTCGPKGRIEMSANAKGWEVWRFIETGDNGHVRISSWTHDHHVLCDDPSGEVKTTDNLRGSWEKWKVELAPEGFDGVVVRSCSHGRYLRSDGESVGTSKLFDGLSTTWDLSAGHRQRYFISSVAHNKRISCSKKGILSTNNRKEWEKWQLQKLDNGLVVLKSETHDKYLICNGNTLEASDEFDDSAIWKVEQSAGKGISIISKLQRKRISCNSDGVLSAVDDSSGTSELWTLEPCMPPTIRKDQMRTLATGGAIAVASIALMPFAVVGAVGALGFGSGGIAAGSIAAGMMSAEAAATGGILAGGTVATLQSIGIAGLGLAGTSAAMGGGAIVGASALGISAAVAGVHKKDFEEGAEIANPQENRPFCNWRLW